MMKFELGNGARKVLNVFAYIFNIVYFLVCTALSSLLVEFSSDISFNIMLPILILFILPGLFFIFAFVKKDREKNIKFFFGLEVPIFMLSLFRMFMVRELTPFYLLIIISIVTCIIFYLIDLLDIKAENKLYEKTALFAYETPVLMGIYFGLISLFFIIPALINTIKAVINFDYVAFFKLLLDIILNINFVQILSGLLFLFYFVLFSLFLLMLWFLFIIAPLTGCVVYIKEFIKRYKAVNNSRICILFASLYILILGISSFHFSDINISKDYESVKNAGNYQELYISAQNVLKKENIIKKSLLDEYLAKLRYISDVRIDMVSYIYQRTGFPKEFSDSVQKLYNIVTYPFHYHKSFIKRTADNVYKEIFDEDIQLGQKNIIAKSVNSTFFTKKEGASLLDINSKDVKILSKEIKIDSTEIPEIYKVTVTESYRNKTNRNKEVYYEFSLPKDAVVTGLELGNNLQYKGQLSPKGAARKTYKSEIRRKSDPALLEKNGLRQYTLRVYPVEPYKNEKNIQKVRFEYLIYANDGKIALPNIFQTRNAYMGVNSEYKVIFNNNKIKVKSKENSAEITVGDRELEDAAKIDKYFKNKQSKKAFNKKIALLLDTSYSNKINWKKYLNKYSNTYFSNNSVDYYYFNKFLSNKMLSLEEVKQINFARTARYDAYCSLKENYDAVIMLTDTSVFDDSKYIKCNINTPLYVVHTDKENSGKIPPYNKAFTNLLYKTNGDIYTDVESAFTAALLGQYELKTGNFAFDNAKKIDYILRTKNPDDINVKAEIHNLAKEAGIVSDYSSYIVLVNDFQRKELEKNEKLPDKYDADLETGEDEGLKNQNNNIFSVPEPKDWIFLSLIMIIAFIYIFKKRIKCIFFKY